MFAGNADKKENCFQEQNEVSKMETKHIKKNLVRLSHQREEFFDILNRVWDKIEKEGMAVEKIVVTPQEAIIYSLDILEDEQDE